MDSIVFGHSMSISGIWVFSGHHYGGPFVLWGIYHLAFKYYSIIWASWLLFYFFTRSMINYRCQLTCFKFDIPSVIYFYNHCSSTTKDSTYLRKCIRNYDVWFMQIRSKSLAQIAESHTTCQMNMLLYIAYIWILINLLTTGQTLSGEVLWEYLCHEKTEEIWNG